MFLETMIGSDDRRIKGRKGTYTIVQINDFAFEIWLEGNASLMRLVGYASSGREAEKQLREYDAK